MASRRAFLHSGHPMLATLALIAGLYHTINHAMFKAPGSLARARCCTPRTRATWSIWAGWPNGCPKQLLFLIGRRHPAPPLIGSSA
jgi:hypothetical protein